MSSYPILYSFRRCPYAMRARMALALHNVTVEIREIILKDKPVAMLEASPKGTVPVLITTDNQVIDESIDIINYAILHSRQPSFSPPCVEQKELIALNDSSFKRHLDHYKYFDRYPQATQNDYRQMALVFVHQLESRLQHQTYLFGDHISYADIAIFPFIRQFAHVDKQWFEQAPYPNVQRWLTYFLSSDEFSIAMKKLPLWRSGDTAKLFPPEGNEPCCV